MTREEKNRKQREYRALNKNKCTAKYEKTKNGFLMRLYRNMKSRVEGVQYKKHHLYKGKSLLNKQLFYSWALSSDDFHKLFKVWTVKKHKMTLCPSVDRINSAEGYSISNMEWVTHSENSRRGVISKCKRMTLLS